MNNIKAAMISAIVVCMLILGVLYYSDVRDQRAYRAWAQEQNQILNESRRAAEAEAAKAREIAKAEKAAEAGKAEKAEIDRKAAATSEAAEAATPGDAKREEADAAETSSSFEGNDTDGTRAERSMKYTTTDRLRVRNAASLSGAGIGVLDEGTVLEEPRPEGDWIRIRYKGGEGYVSAEYVSVEDE